MIRINTKAQSWSVDIMLAAVIFMSSFFIFYALFSENSNTKVSNLRDDASTVIKQVSTADNSLRIINSNEVNVSKIQELKNLSYDELKRRLRIEGDFCIYFEDEKGNIVLINNSYKGVGTQNINISGTPCSQK